MKNVVLIDHPLVQHKLSLMRKQETSCNQFRNLLKEISTLLAYEVTRNFPLYYEAIQTPLAAMKAPFFEGKNLVLVSILRAGNGLLDGMLALVPSARVGHIGLYRDPETLMAVEYYFKMPPGVEGKDLIVVDPMLATGHSACAALTRLKLTHPQSLKFVCLLAAPEGIEELQAVHPDVTLYTAAIDEKLNEHGYILPGLGDAGDRIYRTK